LHDPFYYLVGIWAKAFSVYAHIFCQHFGEELAPEMKTYVEASFERFMRFVKGYKILSTRRLAPLDKRIAKIDFKSLPILVSPGPRESKSVVNKTNPNRPSIVASLVRTEESTTGVPRSESYVLSSDTTKDTSSPTQLDRKETQASLIKNDKDGYGSDPETGGEEEPARDREEDDLRQRATTKSDGDGLDTSCRLEQSGRESPGDEAGSKDKVS